MDEIQLAHLHGPHGPLPSTPALHPCPAHLPAFFQLVPLDDLAQLTIQLRSCLEWAGTGLRAPTPPVGSAVI